MRRRLAVGVVLTAVVTLLAAPAWAQYGGGGGGGGDTTTTTTTTTTTAPAADDNRVEGDVSPDEVEAGDPVTFTGPDGACEPGTTATLFVVSSEEGSEAQEVGTTTADSDGALNATVTIPATSAEGVYYVYAVCTGADDEQNVVIAPVSVTAGEVAAAGLAGDTEPPGVVQDLQMPASQEAALMDAVADGARLEISGGGVVADTAGSGSSGFALTGAEIGTSVAVAVVLVLIGFGFIQLRRRPREVKS